MYWSRTGSLLEFLAWLGMCLLFWAGGWLLVSTAFRLKREERLLTGLASGWLLHIVFSNLLAYVLPLPAAFWGASLLVLLLGLFSAGRSAMIGTERRLGLRSVLGLARAERPAAQLLVLAGLVLLLALVQRGLAIFDDYFNLPIVSLIAAGDFPPHFPFDTGQPLDYHYGLHLFAASLVRVGGFFPWSALDLSKSLSLALLPMLAYLWVRRMTRGASSRAAGFLGAALALLGGGARWLLLLLPRTSLMEISAGVHLMGSAAASAPDFYSAMTGPWKIEGSGPFPFPFAFGNGVFPPGVMSLASVGAVPQMSLLLLLLLARRRWAPLNGIVFGLILGSLALTAEHILVLFFAGFFLAVLLAGRLHLSVPRLLTWLWPLLPAALLVLAGGVLTELLRGLFLAAPVAAGSTAGFSLQWPPALLSSHLGRLSLLAPATMVIILAECGLALLLAPLAVWFGLRLGRLGDLVPSALAVGGGISLLVSLFLSYSSERDISRLVGAPLFIWMVMGLPVAWRAAQQPGGVRRFALAAAAGITLLGGVVLFSLQLISLPQPQFSYFVQDPDAVMARDFWNKLRPGAQVFEPSLYRPVTLFGRGSGHAFKDPYNAYPEWERLEANPDPRLIAAAGYDYIYMDKAWYQSTTPQQKDALRQGCVKRIAQVTTDDKDYRWLLDIHACR
jgi:hypothetical protein